MSLCPQVTPQFRHHDKSFFHDVSAAAPFFDVMRPALTVSLQQIDKGHQQERRNVKQLFWRAIRGLFNFHNLPIPINAQLLGRTTKGKAIYQDLVRVLTEFDTRMIAQSCFTMK